MYRDTVLISTKCGDLDGDSQCEKVTLIGTQYEENSPYMKSLQLIIEKNDNTKNIFNIEFEGYAFNLFLVNILK